MVNLVQELCVQKHGSFVLQRVDQHGENVCWENVVKMHSSGHLENNMVIWS